MAFKTLLYEKKGAIAWIVLNRPEALNAFNIQMRDDLYELLTAIKDDADLRVVIMKGAGEKAFCAGADLSEFLTAPFPTAARRIRAVRDVWQLFLSMDRPFIAALHGYVLGSGVEMALFCDVRVASDDARFAFPETALGIIPAAGGTQTLPRVIRRAGALEMLFLGKMLTGKEAHRAGLVNRVVPKERLEQAALDLALKISSYDPGAVRRARGAVLRGLDLSLREGLELERTLALPLLCQRRLGQKEI